MILVALVAWIMDLFLRTNLGQPMQPAGDNPRVVRALEADVGRMITIGLMMSNSLVALSGAILAQYQGFADVQMGIGMIVLRTFASMVLGRALVDSGLGRWPCHV